MLPSPIMYLATLLPETPTRALTHPSGALGVMCDTDTEIVVDLAPTGEALLLTFVRYAPDHGVTEERELGQASTVCEAARVIRETVREVARAEEAAQREHCAAARKAVQR